MLVIQILLIAFVLFAIFGALKRFRQGRLPFGWLTFWIVFWLVVGTAVLLPQTTDVVARFVGVGRGVDAAVYISVVALFYLLFRLFVKIEDMERQMTKLVRKLAIKELDEKTYE